MAEKARCHSAQAPVVQNTPPSNLYQVPCHLSTCALRKEVDLGRGRGECAKVLMHSFAIRQSAKPCTVFALAATVVAVAVAEDRIFNS
jgi:hypothetical protein